MKRFFNWKILSILIVAVLVGYYDAPNQWQKIPFTPDFVLDSKVRLGLDLQGGTQLDYKMNLSKVAASDQKAIIEGVREVIERRVNNLGVSEPNIYESEIGREKHIIVELAGIKDINEAKRLVGKTIQLEFKEEKENIDPKKKENALRDIENFYREVQKDPILFAEKAVNKAMENKGEIDYAEQNWIELESVSENIRDEIKNMKAGDLRLVTKELSVGYRQVEGKVQEQKGYAIIRMAERKKEPIEKTIGKQVEVSHVLISYEGATGAAASVKRSRGEAKDFAKELLQKIFKGEKPFDDAAREFSDEPGAATSAGKLPQPAQFENAPYVQSFNEAAMELQKEGDISPIVESEFGFHIIKAGKITPSRKETKTADQVRYQYVIYSTTPNPWKETKLTGEHFKHADVDFTQTGAVQVAIEFNDEGAKLFEELTEKNVGKRIAIFVGGGLISAPTVNQKISGGRATITGNFTPQDAQALARDLNTGAIPAPIGLVGQYSIGASLGQDALRDSIKAGALGIALLVIFMLLYYRLPGLFANIALVIYSVLFFFLIKSSLPLPLALLISVVLFVGIVYKILNSDEGAWEKLLSFALACFILFFLTFLLSNPVVLTLAGVAGVILSIGMAVDANVLIFERLKEELRAGRTLSSAIEVGFDRAWSSIRDSNFSSLITCAILYYFGSSIVRGFALTLAAGILISMFTAITITKNFLSASSGTLLAQNLWLFGLSKNPKPHKNFFIIRKTKIWFTLSGIVIAAGIISLLVSGLHLGMDFKGGTLLDLQFETSVTAEALKEAVPSAQVIPNGVTPDGATRMILRMEHIDEPAHEKILNSLNEKFGNVEEIRFNTIGPTIGDRLKAQSVLALIVALFAIVLYIAFAFRKVPKGVNPWKMGLCAIVALFHDVIIPVGIFSLLKVEIDAFFITAILTVLGFSVHDTIVVFDRIRENLITQPKGETFEELADRSMTQTMARSINTSLTTLITLLALLIFGSPSIFYFVLVLVIGISVGTYSSIFIATPLLVWWKKKA